MIFDKIIGPERPVTWVFHFWPILAASFVGSLGATWLCKKIAIRFGIVDRPDDLVKTHKEPIAYLGGVGMFIGLTMGVLAGTSYLRDEESFRPILKWLLGILGGGAIACIIGLADDIFVMKPKQKILGQAAAAVILLLVGITPNLYRIMDPLNLSMSYNLEMILSVFIVICFVLGATNSLNLLDGLDGLCGGVMAIITVAMLLLSIHLATWGYSEVGDPVRIIVCLGLVGAVCGFLPFNRYPAKIFMGDAGSMLLGFMAATLMLLFAEQIPRWWMASIVVFGLPILDTAVALVRRLLNHKPLFVSDRGHIYDQMIDRGIPLKRTVTICYMLSGIYAVIGLAMSQIRTRYAAVVYVFVFAVSGLIVWKKGYLKMEGLRGAIHKEEA
ncbi:MAG: MraY family glycosyltransferase [Phycisphaerae bacterium]|nr:MraY family glycosyltransferase [Phycisphaerae bacterium]MDD5381436.1 MraY family glycosyltransferase [Phycisphaerae bacterium]